MKRTVLIAAAAALLATPTIAQDIAEGEELTAKRCKSCHMISDGDNVILKGGKTGPNLYAVMGRTAGTADFKRYGKDLQAAGEAGLVWDEAQIIAYLEDPRAFLRTYLDDPKAKSKMSFKLKKEEDRANVAAYLASIGATN